MSAFLKIDSCKTCHRSLPWECVPAIILNGRMLAGTGAWRTQLVDDLCPACIAALQIERQEERRIVALRDSLVKILGGMKPYREFTFERYQVASGNRMAYERSKQFNPA